MTPGRKPHPPSERTFARQLMSLAAFVTALLLPLLVAGCCSEEKQWDVVKKGIKEVNSRTFPGNHPKKERKAYKRYVGTWSGDTIWLKLDPDGRVEYKKQGKWGQKTVKAKIQRFRHRKVIKIGALNLTSDTLKIDEPPKKEDGLWTMTINGEELRRE